MDSNDKYTSFANWCSTNGIIAPKLHYPAHFPYCGVSIKKDIAHNEVMYCIPFKLVVTVTKAKAEPKLAEVFNNNPEVFSDFDFDYWESNVLFAWLLF